MRHGFQGRRFNRTAEHREAMFANMSAALIKHEQIVTTLPKAKDLRPVLEKLVTLAKRGNLHAAVRPPPSCVTMPRSRSSSTCWPSAMPARNGGYLRIMRAGFRHGDSAPMAVIEFVDRDVNARGQIRARARRPRKRPKPRRPEFTQTSQDIANLTWRAAIGCSLHLCMCGPAWPRNCGSAWREVFQFETPYCYDVNRAAGMHSRFDIFSETKAPFANAGESSSYLHRARDQFGVLHLSYCFSAPAIACRTSSRGCPPTTSATCPSICGTCLRSRIPHSTSASAVSFPSTGRKSG